MVDLRDSSGTWRARMRAKARAEALSWAAVLALTALLPIGGIVVALVIGNSSGYLVAVNLAGLALCIGGAVWVIARTGRLVRQRTEDLIDLVEAHDGRVCPRCSLVLDALPPDDEHELVCGRCDGRWNDSTVRARWATLGPDQRRAPASSDGRPADTDPATAFVVRAIFLGYLLFMVVTGISLLVSNFEHAGPILGTIRTLPVLGMALGLGLLCWTGRNFARKDSALRCRHCDYPRLGQSDDRCPECGQPWDGEPAVGRRRGLHAVTRLVGTVLVGSFFVVHCTPMNVVAPGAWSSLEPTWMVFEEIRQGQRRGLTSRDAWERLVDRSLSEDQRRAVIELLIGEESIARPSLVSDTAWEAAGAMGLLEDFDEDQQRRMIVALDGRKRVLRHLPDEAEDWVARRLEAGAVPGDLLGVARSLVE